MPPARAVRLTPEQRSQLERWSRGGSTPYRLVVRSQIVLLAAYGHSNRQIGRLLRTNPITVARWRSRFTLLGLEGIRTEAPRSGSPPPVPKEVVQLIVRKTLSERPPAGPRWSTRSLARHVGVSHSTVRKIWKRFGLRPNRSRVALLAEGSPFRRRELDLVGVYVNPPQRALALSLRDPLGMPSGDPNPLGGDLSPGPERPTRRWMADLVTTLTCLDADGPPRTSRRHVDQEFLAFLRSVEERLNGNDKVVLFAESSGPSLSPNLQRWLRRHPEFTTQICAGADDWEKKVLEGVRTLTAPRGPPGPPTGLPRFLTAAARWRQESAQSPGPFAWTSK